MTLKNAAWILLMAALLAAGPTWADDEDEMQIDAESSIQESEATRHAARLSEAEARKERVEADRLKNKAQLDKLRAEDKRKDANAELARSEKEIRTLKLEQARYQADIARSSKEIATLEARLNSTRRQLQVAREIVAKQKEQRNQNMIKTEMLKRQQEDASEKLAEQQQQYVRKPASVTKPVAVPQLPTRTTPAATNGR